MSVTQQRGMLWGTLGTYRRAVGAGKIILTRARTPARGIQVGGVLRLATELLPNDSLTWHDLSPMGDISARRWLSHDDRRDQILLPIGNIFCGVAADCTTTDATKFCLQL